MADETQKMRELELGVSKVNTQLQRMMIDFDQVSSRVERVTELFSKQRDLMGSESREVKEFTQSLIRAAEAQKRAFPEQFKGMNNFSVYIAKIEQDLGKYAAAAEKAQASLKRLRETEKTQLQKRTVAQTDILSAQENIAGAQKLKELSGLRRAPATKENLERLHEITGEYGSASKLRKVAKEQEKGLSMFKDVDIESEKKRLDFAKMQVDLSNKHLVKIDQIKKTKKQEVDQSLKSIELGKKDIDNAEKLFKVSKGRFDEERRRDRERRRGSGVIDVASDLNLPGVSQAATIARYAGRSSNMFGGDEAGGLGGFAKRGAGLLAGGVVGAGVLAGGYTALQGYKTYDMAHQMAPGRVQLAGLMGNQRGSQIRGELSSDKLAKLGYGPLENIQAAQQMARTLGSEQTAREGLMGVSKTARRFGLDRGEVTGAAGSLMQAGVAPQQATKQLEAIMIEGVRSGIDRARITHFTEQVVGIQEQVLSATGENKAKDIADELGKMLRAAPKERAESFMKGPEMGAVRSIDALMKQIGRTGGGGGPGQATVLRAMGMGAEGGATDLKSYVGSLKQLEGGLFGGEKGQATERLTKIVDQFVKESGGSKEAALINMQQSLGIGIGQGEKLMGLTEKLKSGQLRPEDQKELNSVMEEMKDPMARLLESAKKQEAQLARAAEATLPAILKIDEMMTDLQAQSLDVLKDMYSLWEKLSGSGSFGDKAKAVGQFAGDHPLVAAAAGATAGYVGYKAVKGTKGLMDTVRGGKAAAGGVEAVVGAEKGAQALVKGSKVAGALERGAVKALPGAAKGLGKVAGKSIPFLGSLISAGFAAKDVYDLYEKYKKGETPSGKDWAELVADIVGVGAGLIPGVGGAVAAGASAATSLGLGMMGDSAPSKGAASAPTPQPVPAPTPETGAIEIQKSHGAKDIRKKLSKITKEGLAIPKGAEMLPPQDVGGAPSQAAMGGMDTRGLESSINELMKALGKNSSSTDANTAAMRTTGSARPNRVNGNIGGRIVPSGRHG